MKHTFVATMVSNRTNAEGPVGPLSSADGYEALHKPFAVRRRFSRAALTTSGPQIVLFRLASYVSFFLLLMLPHHLFMPSLVQQRSKVCQPACAEAWPHRFQWTSREGASVHQSLSSGALPSRVHSPARIVRQPNSRQTFLCW